MTAIIIEDELKSLQYLIKLLGSHCPFISIVGSGASIQQGIDLYKTHQPDLIFLDIELGLENGFDLLHELRNTSYSVIFTTAYDCYGIRAIKFSALDYLLKPIDPLELIQAVNKALHHHHRLGASHQIQHLLDQLERKNGQEKTIAIPQSKELLFQSVSDIIYCEASNNYTTIHLKEGEKLVSSRGIFHYDELLSPLGFMRVHQSYLVNPSYIKSLNRDQCLLLKNRSVIPVARLKMALVRKRMMQ